MMCASFLTCLGAVEAMATTTSSRDSRHDRTSAVQRTWQLLAQVRKEPKRRVGAKQCQHGVPIQDPRCDRGHRTCQPRCSGWCRLNHPEFRAYFLVWEGCH